MRIFYVYVFVLLSRVVFAQDPCYWQITDEDGLPSMTVYNIQQDSKGFMWIGTAGGLCRYDGKEFEYYRHAEQLDDEIIHLKIDSLDRVWYSNLTGQLFIINKENIKLLTNKKFGDKYSINHFYFTKSEVVLSATNKAVNKQNVNYYSNIENEAKPLDEWKTIKIERAVLLSYNKKNKNYCPVIFESSSVSFGKEGNDILGEKIESLLEEGIKIGFGDYTGEKGRNEIVFMSGDTVLMKVGNSIMQIDKSSQELKIHEFEEMLNSSIVVGNDIWVAEKDQNVYRIPQFQVGNKIPLFKNIGFNFLFSDHENNIWGATSNKGIFIIPHKELNHFYSKNTSLESDPINFIKPDLNQNRLLLISDKNQIFEYKNEELNLLFKLKNSLKISSGAQIKDDDWMFGGDFNLIEINLNNFNYQAHDFPSKFLHTNYSDTLWIGGYHKCFKIPMNKLEEVSNPYSYKYKNDYTVIREKTYAVQSDYERNVYIGTTRGLYIYDESSQKAQPFLIENEHKPYRFTAITQSPYDSCIWAATHGHGVLSIKNGIIVEQFTEERFLASNICNDIFADDVGNIWIATQKGIQKHNLKTKTFELINKYDGLPTNETTKVAVWDSTVFVGTNKGLITFPIDFETKNNIQPLLHIAGISIFDKDTVLHENYDLTYEQNSIQINYVGLAYKSRGNLNYKYRMIGIDSNWISTQTRFVRFQGLMPGNYEFQVIAINEDGIESEKQATVKFEISPPYWQTWWFRILVLFTSIGIIGLFFNTRYRRIRNREKMKRDFKDQVNELRGQALQTQMNPHFIFNSLNAIQHFLTTNDQENAMIYMARFAKLIRHIFEHSKEKNITLNQEFEFLNLYISLEKLRFKDKVNVDFKVSEKLAQQGEALEIPPLLIQPIVENAFKHGLFHKKTQGDLLIDFSFEKNVLKIIIEDDGIGRKKSEEINLWRKGNHKSSGVSSTRERILLLNKEENSALNDLKIIDLHNSANESVGTRIEITLVPKVMD